MGVVATIQAAGMFPPVGSVVPIASEYSTHTGFFKKYIKPCCARLYDVPPRGVEPLSSD
jgi:hypothetical protein